ncbi:unnamed protein product [Pieris brassicae]|uniref:Uncharacterized protein n=1 Tax=Pieris brassicae TaxID=7116 RepID=A0A9P0X9P4_PIEBR|nr:unnamed protein product [Pieris brassicae]
MALASGSLESTTASSSRSGGRSNDAQPGTSSDQIKLPDEPMDITDLPIPSRSTAPVETRHIAASMSATSFTEQPKIATPKSKAQRQREYRRRMAASRTPAQLKATRISDTATATNKKTQLQAT